jgi:hypothetical protein
MGNREHLIEAGWKQGILLASNDVRLKDSAHYEVPDDALFLIVSQTCDLIQGSFASEPYFECLCLHTLNREPNGAYLGGKNSRKIEFSLDPEADGNIHWFALPYERHLVKRELLLDLRPESSIENEQTLKMILRWLSRRYTRTAFPDAFVSRIDKRKGAIGKKFFRLNAHISNVFVRVNPFEELDNANEYGMEIMLVMDAEKFDDTKTYRLCNTIKNELEYQLGECDGIKVDDISIESTAFVTIEELKDFREWDYSHLSFREIDTAAMPIEI